MPIVFVHGVSVRSDAPGYIDFWQGLETFLRSTIAPVITDDPDSAFIVASHWGDVAASLAWGGVSRPRSPILGMGGDTADATSFEKAIAVAELAKAAQDIPLDNQTGGSTGGLVPAGPGGSPTGSTQPQRLKDLSPDQLSDLAVAVIRRLADDPVQRTRLALIADEVAHAPNTFPQLAQQPDVHAEIQLLQSLIKTRYEQETGITGMGVPGWLANFGTRLGETLDRAVNLPGFVVTRVVAEMRKPLNDLVVGFIEDVFVYLAHRGNASHPGAIPSTVLDTLAQARQNQQ